MKRKYGRTYQLHNEKQTRQYAPRHIFYNITLYKVLIPKSMDLLPKFSHIRMQLCIKKRLNIKPVNCPKSWRLIMHPLIYKFLRSQLCFLNVNNTLNYMFDQYSVSSHLQTIPSHIQSKHNKKTQTAQLAKVLLEIQDFSLSFFF